MTHQAIIVYGPDRVGKTTAINQAVKLRKAGYNGTIDNASRHHFVSPYENDPTFVKQYLDFFSEKSNLLELTKNQDFLYTYYFDRGVGECEFYEFYRRNRTPSRRNILQVEMKFLDTFAGAIRNVVIKAQWSLVKERHYNELRDDKHLDPTCDEFQKALNLAMDEHHAYYDSLAKYLSWSSIPTQVYYTEDTLNSDLLEDII
jgi:hypothetical protein